MNSSRSSHLERSNLGARVEFEARSVTTLLQGVLRELEDQVNAQFSLILWFPTVRGNRIVSGHRVRLNLAALALKLRHVAQARCRCVNQRNVEHKPGGGVAIQAGKWWRRYE